MLGAVKRLIRRIFVFPSFEEIEVVRLRALAHRVKAHDSALAAHVLQIADATERYITTKNYK